MNLNSITDNILTRLKDIILPESKYVYVAMGDSTVEGIGTTHIKKSYPALIFETLKHQVKRAEFRNLGKSAARINDVVANQLHPTIFLEPDLVTISVGANDLRHRTRPGRFAKELSYLIEALKKNTNAKIVINNIPDFSYLKSLPLVARLYTRVMLKKFNKIIEEEARKADIFLVDLYSQSKIFAKRYPEFISEDGFHPSDAGYAIWATAIITQIKHLFIDKHLVRSQR